MSVLEDRVKLYKFRVLVSSVRNVEPSFELKVFTCFSTLYTHIVRLTRTHAFIQRVLQSVSYTHLDVYKRQVVTRYSRMQNDLSGLPSNIFTFNNLRWQVLHNHEAKNETN